MKIPIQKIQTQNCCNLAATKRERERRKNKKTNTKYLEVNKKKKKKKGGFVILIQTHRKQVAESFTN
jgi:hypothetical protein